MNNKTNNKSTVRMMMEQTEFVLIVLIIIMCIILNFINEGFFTAANFRSMSRGFAIEGFMLIGMCFLLITGAFDISVASVMAIAGYAFTSLAVAGINTWIALLLAILLGGFVGLCNGLIITKLQVNPFITTLATMTIVRGLVLAISQGNPIRLSTPEFNRFSAAAINGIPVMFIVLVIAIIILDIMLRKVRWFRQLFFIGGNENSAELTGINVLRMRLILFIIIGALAALSGALSSSRLEASVPTAYVGTEMKLMVACVIGGCSLNGGRGSLFGAALGLAFLFLLDNGMVMMGIDIYWFQGILGVFLIGVVLINTFSASTVEKGQKRARELGARLS
ncbi:MAG TPA: ABC transporter permease [Anaerovoracaceae bacterium]|nr:ABC transporter permease [Anaerovoracaceae bacterium]